MPLFNLVLRQYTPPTCTLEIKAKESPLSRWVGLKVFNQLRFQLSFDDPRQSEEKRITIWGDRAELEALCDAVTSYVQNFLDQPPPQVPLGLLASADGSMPPMTPDNGNSYHLQAIPGSRFNSYPTGNAAAYDPLATTTEQSEEEQEQGYAPEVERPPLLGLSPTPYLQPRGLLAHDLFLGALQTEDSGPVVTLSALQLFDLATALDEYAAEVVALPKVNRRFNLQDRPTWTYAAAGGLVAVVGLALAVGQVLKRPATKTAVLTPTTQSNLAQQTPIPDQVLPGATPLVPNSPGATPLVPNSPGARGLAPNLSGQNPLGQTSQVPPPLGTSLPPTAGIQQPGGSNSFPLTAPQTSSGGFNSSKTFRPSFSVAPTLRQQQRAVTTAKRPSTPTRSASSQLPRAATAAKRPSTPTRSASSQLPRATTSAKRPSTSTRSIPSIATLPPISNTSSAPRPRVKLGDRTLPNIAASPAIPPIASNFDPSPQTLPSDLVPSIGSNSGVSSSGLGAASALQQPSEANNIAKGSTAFDTIPQVSETRNYLQNRWKPPQGLTQPLEYTLQIGGDGAIERIIPRTQVAKNYIDRTGMPIVGEKFVSPIQGGGNPQIRVVLNPDGKVETFVEQ